MGAYNFANTDIIMMLGGQLLFIYFVAMIFLFNDSPIEQIGNLINTVTTSSNNTEAKAPAAVAVKAPNAATKPANAKANAAPKGNAEAK